MEACDMPRGEHEEAKRSWLCGECLQAKPGIGPIDVRIDEAIPRRIALTFVSGTTVGLCKEVFLDALVGWSTAQEELHLGQVRSADGESVPGWVSFRGKKRVAIRGSKNVAYRRCGTCGQGVYFAMGKRYLFPSPGEGTMFESNLGGLVIPEAVLDPKEAKKWPGTYVERLEVLKAPLDGLGVLEGY
jgi:hypothetical protein